MGATEASVIIIGHDKKEFILEALNSVVEQNIERNRYEIIVIKNFEDNEVDARISETADIIIESNEPGPGSKVKDAVERSSGDVLFFLDYDDLFVRDKLRIVLDLFRNSPGLVYYHNAHVSLMNQDGSITEPVSPAPPEFFQMESSEIRGEVLARFLGYYPDFNGSSITVRRSIVEPRMSYLPGIMGHPDSFMMYCALDSDGIIVDDPRPLTIYRIHESSTNPFASSFSGYFTLRCMYLRRTVDDWNIIVSMLSDKRIRSACGCDLTHSLLLTSFFDLRAGRSRMFRESLKFAGCLRSRMTRNLLVLELLALISSGAPKLTRMLYFAVKTKIL
ncbi:MAG: glycosyltransferase family 2 protein [Thermoplasmataceae archaeon]